MKLARCARQPYGECLAKDTMIELYLDPSCPFCVAVTDHLEKNKIPYTPKELSIYSDSEVRRQLIALGGKRQVPFLHHPERNVLMYESADIIAYADEHGRG